jgi:hypothetical protein
VQEGGDAMLVDDEDVIYPSEPEEEESGQQEGEVR